MSVLAWLHTAAMPSRRLSLMIGDAVLVCSPELDPVAMGRETGQDRF